MPEPPIVRGPPETPRPDRPPRMHYRAPAERWSPRTYADELSERGEDPRVRVRCGCGRTRPAFAVIDARVLPDAVRGGRDWMCDACKTDLVRSRRYPVRSRAELVQMLGAPTEVQERIARGEAWMPHRRAANEERADS